MDLHRRFRPSARVAWAAVLGLSLGLLALTAPLGSAASKPQPAPPVGRLSHNLLSGESAAFQHAAGSWRVWKASLAVGSRGVLTATATSASSFTLASGTGARATAVRPGSTYQGTAQVLSSKSGRVVRPALVFFDSHGKWLQDVPGSPVTTSSRQWVYLPGVVGIAPVGAARVAMVVRATNSSKGSRLYLRQPLLVGATPSQQAVVPPLRVVGNRLYDARGPLVLRGLHRAGLEEARGAYLLNDADIGQMKRWGANVVRLGVSQAYWPTDLCTGRESYAEMIDGIVRSATRRGMVLLLDLHTQALTPCGKVMPHKMPDQGSVTFWNSAANRYKNNPLVAFDLYNEPHDIDEDLWLNGGTVKEHVPGQPVDVVYRAVGMQRLYDTVRATGAQNLVVVSPRGWASWPPDGSGVQGTNLMYGFHVYTCPVKFESGCPPRTLIVDHKMGAWRSFARSHAMMLTEFGYPEPYDGRFMRRVIAFAQQMGWGWITFSWEGYTGGDFGLLATHDARRGYEPNGAGMPALAELSLSPQR